MKEILITVIAGMISTASIAEVPNTFVSGEVATAAKFNENFTALSNEIDDVRTSATTFNENFTSLSNEIDDVRTSAAKFNENFTSLSTSLSNEIDDIRTSATTFNENFTSLSTSLSNEIDDVRTSATKFNENFTSLSTSLSNEINDVRTSAAKFNENFTSLSNEIDDVRTSATKFNENFTSLSNEIDDVRTSAAKFNENFTSLSTSLSNEIDDVRTSAAKFNENFTSLFTSLSNEIDDVRASVANISNEIEPPSGDSGSDGSILAKVNGIDMRVSSTRPGLYNIITPTGKGVSVNADGYPISPFDLVYESTNCTGQAYIRLYQLEEYTSKSAGHVFANPKLSARVSIVYSNGELGYSLNDTPTKVNYRSGSSKSLKEPHLYRPYSCNAFSGTHIASPVLPNDPAVTGINSVPLIISGVGSELEISPTEIGTPPPMTTGGLFSVYANGTKIGTTTRYPFSNSRYISVTLDGSQTSIRLYRDGTSSGNTVPLSADLYYRSSDCSGTPYYKLIDNADKVWLDTTRFTQKIITNQGEYYTLSSQVYRVSLPFLSSKRYNHDRCFVSTIDGSNRLYSEATLIDAPEIPNFSPPITIEGYSDTPYNSLPEAF